MKGCDQLVYRGSLEGGVKNVEIGEDEVHFYEIEAGNVVIKGETDQSGSVLALLVFDLDADWQQELFFYPDIDFPGEYLIEGLSAHSLIFVIGIDNMHYDLSVETSDSNPGPSIYPNQLASSKVR